MRAFFVLADLNQGSYASIDYTDMNSYNEGVCVVKYFKFSINVSILTIFVAVLFPATSQAIPAFARQANMTCSTCHTAWPSLNAFGRQYKEHGYRIGHLETPNKKISKDLKWNESLPVSVLLVARPYDKKGSGETKLRALHEVELMVAGPMGEKFSSFIEIEAEDEDLNARGFETGIPSAALTYNADEAVHLQVSWGSITWFDPYNSYSNHLRMTRGGSAVYDQSFGGADNGGKIKSARQNITVYGRPSPNLFYGVSISGDAGDAEGEEGSTFTARVAFDVMPSLTVGALVISGTANASSTADTVGIVGGVPAVIAGSTTPERDYSRTAIDLQSEVAGFTFNAVFLTATDDNATATAEVDNDVFSLQALYTVKTGGRVTWAPLIRLDSYETGGGAVDVDEITLGINYYFTENVRGMLELWDRDSSADGKDDDRITVQVIAAF